MSIEGNLVLFTEARARNPARLLCDALKIIRPAIIIGVFRTPGKERSWAARKKLTKNLRAHHKRGEVPTSSGVTLAKLNPLKMICKSCSVDEVIKKAPELYRRGTCLFVWLTGDEFTRDIAAAYERDVPPDIRNGSTLINSTWLTIGHHDVFGCPEDPNRPVYFGRAFFSLRLNGYGAPTDWIETRRRSLQIPEVLRAKAELEVVTGPLQQCMYWSV